LPVIEVAFLNGQELPTIETAEAVVGAFFASARTLTVCLARIASILRVMISRLHIDHAFSPSLREGVGWFHHWAFGQLQTSKG